MKNRIVFLLTMLAVCLCMACSSDDELSEQSTVSYFGTPVPYTPLAESDFPDWLRNLKSEKSMIGLKSIFEITTDNGVVYHLEVTTDSSLRGRYYDEDGNLINGESTISAIKAQTRSVRCIFYRDFSAITINQ